MKRKLDLSIYGGRPPELVWTELSGDWICCRGPHTIKRGELCLMFSTSARRGEAICARCWERDRSLQDSYPKPGAIAKQTDASEKEALKT